MANDHSMKEEQFGNESKDGGDECDARLGGKVVLNDEHGEAGE